MQIFFQCQILAKQLGDGNDASSARLLVMLNDVNDNPPKFIQEEWHAKILENSDLGTAVVTVEAVDPDLGINSKVYYTKLTGPGSSAFKLDLITGSITVLKPNELDAERTPSFKLTVEATDEEGNGLTATSIVSIDLIDVNDEPPRFEKDLYEFIIDVDGKGFTAPAVIKATDADISPPNNVIHYELVQSIVNLTLDQDTGELKISGMLKLQETLGIKARAWDGGVPRLWGECDIHLYPAEGHTRRITFIVPGLNPNRKAIEDELSAITGSQVTVKEVRRYRIGGDNIER